MNDAGEHLDAVKRFRLRPWAMLTAALLGALSGAAAAAVRWMFRGLQWIFTRHAGALPLVAAGMPSWRRFLTPVFGAACATALLALRAHSARRSKRGPRPYGEYVEAVRREHGNIPFRPNVWRTLASAFSVATGAAIGREGSMIQFAAAATALLNRTLHARLPKTRTMPSALAVACGVAAGVTAAYQAPLAGVCFAAEIAIGSWSLWPVVALAIAAGAGELVSRQILGAGPLYALHLTWAFRPWQCLGLLGAGAVFGVLGPLYQRWLKLWTAGRRLPWALVWGGAAVGAVSLLEPRVWGNGDVGLGDALGLNLSHGALPITLGAMALMLALRLIATGAATGVGTVGGVFTPTMFTGAVAASVAVRLLHHGDPVVFALAGMTALVAAATHAPMMAAFMAVELTGAWIWLPELLLVSLVASALARVLSEDSLYAIASEQPVKAAEPDGHDGR